MIICSGCSFTSYKWETWPKYVEWFQDQKIVNLGQSGSGNETIGRLSVNAALKWKSKIKKIYIMWSGSDRYERITNAKIDYVSGEATYARYDSDFDWSVWIGGHESKEKHKFYVENFLNERHNWFRTLERILYTQLILQKINIDYEMMVMNKDVIKHHDHSNAEKAIYNQINWNRFIFYKDLFGLQEYAKEFPEHVLKHDPHPTPYVAYQWTKNIIYKSQVECPKKELEKIKNRTKELDERYRLS